MITEGIGDRQSKTSIKWEPYDWKIEIYITILLVIYYIYSENGYLLWEMRNIAKSPQILTNGLD